MQYGGFVSRFCKHLRSKIGKELSRFEQEHERRPSAEELAERLDIPVEKISDTMKVSGRHVSVDAPFVDGEDNSLLDVLPNDDSPMADSTLNQESLSKEVNRARHPENVFRNRMPRNDP